MDLLNVLHSAQTKCTDCKAVFTPNVSFDTSIDAFGIGPKPIWILTLVLTLLTDAWCNWYHIQNVSEMWALIVE